MPPIPTPPDAQPEIETLAAAWLATFPGETHLLQTLRAHLLLADANSAATTSPPAPPACPNPPNPSANPSSWSAPNPAKPTTTRPSASPSSTASPSPEPNTPPPSGSKKTSGTPAKASPASSSSTTPSSRPNTNTSSLTKANPSRPPNSSTSPSRPQNSKKRSVRTLADIEQQIFAAEPNPLQWTDDHHKALARFQRYRTANQNAFDKARKAVEDHLKHHANESRQETKMQMAQTRLHIYEKKNPPKLTIQEQLDMMKKQAIALGYPVPNPNGTL